MSQHKKLEIDFIASSNQAVDVNLIRQAQALTAGLPPTTNGAQYSLRRALAEREDVPTPISYRINRG